MSEWIKREMSGLDAKLQEKRWRRRDPRDRFSELGRLSDMKHRRGCYRKVSRAERYLMFWSRLKHGRR